MKLATIHTPVGKVIIIETDETLDLTSNGVFLDASRLAEHPDISSIEVDLAKTLTIRDSGLAMLLMLRKLTDSNRNRIRLVNCGSLIRSRLATINMARQFQIT